MEALKRSISFMLCKYIFPAVYSGIPDYYVTHSPQASDIVQDYFNEEVSRSTAVSPHLIPAVMKRLFIKLNTPIPSSAAVERVFSTGKDVLRPKRSDLSDINFEALVCLKSDMV